MLNSENGPKSPNAHVFSTKSKVFLNNWLEKQRKKAAEIQVSKSPKRNDEIPLRMATHAICLMVLALVTLLAYVYFATNKLGNKYFNNQIDRQKQNQSSTSPPMSLSLSFANANSASTGWSNGKITINTSLFGPKEMFPFTSNNDTTLAT